VDAFSEVLSAVKLKGALFFHAEFSAPWGFASPQSICIARELMPDAEHLVVYHLLIAGSAYVQLEDGVPLVLDPGDIVVFPHGDPHRMGNGPPSKVLAGDELLAIIKERDLSPLRSGGDGELSRFVCGYMACDPQLCRPILSGLPRVLKINIRTDASGQWLENSIRHLVEEAGAGTPGSEAMLAKLSEALFVDTLRRYMSSLPAEEIGWLAGARDPIVGKSLAILHSRAQDPWTIALLAKEVGLSRSALVERFSRYLLEPPMAYLMRWRMQLAARALASTPQSVAEIAAAVGYESEAAFNRAFKREFGEPPARYRKLQKATKPATAPTAVYLKSTDPRVSSTALESK